MEYLNRLHKSLKFIISGGTAALTKLAIFLLLFYVFNIFYLVSSSVAFIVSVFVGFYLQKYFTFQNLDKKGTHKQIVIFFIISGINLGVNILIMFVLVDVFNITEIISQILSIGIIALWNFFVYQRFVF